MQQVLVKFIELFKTVFPLSFGSRFDAKLRCAISLRAGHSASFQQVISSGSPGLVGLKVT